MNLGTIFERVSNWNEKRYDREYNHKLSVDLLTEEFNEYFEANSLVGQLDSFCDQIYVAMGILWKLNIDGEKLDYNAMVAHGEVTKLIESNTLDPIYFIAAVLPKYAFDNDYPAALAASMIITLSMTQMSAMGLSTEESLEALLVVCDSNDSKSIKKTSSDVKANAGDKGAFFVPPEPRLLKILAKVEARHGS